MKKRTLVIVVADCSGSMAGPLEKQQRVMLWEMTKQFAQAETVGNQAYEVLLFPFSVELRPGAPKPASALTMTDIDAIKTDYPMGSGTALRDAIGWAFSTSKLELDRPNSGIDAVLVTVFTDGVDTASWTYGPSRLAAEYTKLNATGKFTLTIAGPESAKTELVRHVGVYEENFRPWDGTESAQAEVATATSKGVDAYIAARSEGATKVERFYADATRLTLSTVRAFSKQVTNYRLDHVLPDWTDRAVGDFFGQLYQKHGARHFYEVVRKEKLQDGYDIIIEMRRDDGKWEYRLGQQSLRELLGLPRDGDVTVYPPLQPSATMHRVFIETKRSNRKCIEGQRFLTVVA